MMRFPKLKAKDIAKYLKEMDFVIKEEDINDPKPEMLMRVYEHMLDMLMGMTREDFFGPASARGLEQIEYKELHNESLGEAAMMRALIKMMMIAGIHDFSMRDVVAPDKERVKSALSGLINFAKFRSERLEDFVKFCSSCEEMDAQRVAEENKSRQLQDELARIQALRDQEAQAVKKLDEEIAVVAQEVQEKNKEQAHLRKEAETLKTQAQELRDNVQNVKLVLVNRKQEVARIRSQIVQSPEKMKKVMEDLEASVEHETKVVAATTRKVTEVQTKTESLDKVEEDVKKCYEALELCQSEYKKLCSMKKAIKDSDGKIDENTQQMSDLDQSVQHITRLIAAKTDQITAQKQKRAAKIQAAQDALDTIRNSKSHVEVACQQDEMKKLELQGRIQYLQEEIDALNQKHNQQVEMLNGKLQDVQAELSIYKKKVLNSLTNLAQQTSKLNQPVSVK